MTSSAVKYRLRSLSNQKYLISLKLLCMTSLRNLSLIHLSANCAVMGIRSSSPFAVGGVGALGSTEGRKRLSSSMIREIMVAIRSASSTLTSWSSKTSPTIFPATLLTSEPTEDAQAEYARMGFQDAATSRINITTPLTSASSSPLRFPSCWKKLFAPEAC